MATNREKQCTKIMKNRFAQYFITIIGKNMSTNVRFTSLNFRRAHYLKAKSL